MVDRLFDECKSDLIAEIAQNPEDGERVLDVLMIAKYLERIGDHATNIAEWWSFPSPARIKVQCTARKRRHADRNRSVIYDILCGR